jgi:hypothetical protein
VSRRFIAGIVPAPRACGLDTNPRSDADGCAAAVVAGVSRARWRQSTGALQQPTPSGVTAGVARRACG